MRLPKAAVPRAQALTYNPAMATKLLDAESAANFVRKLGEHLDYNINIMNRAGVIIASRDPSRVGSYHDAAQRLVATGAKEEVVEPGTFLPAGVRPGVNLPIVHRSETIGVVGVTGSPAEVKALAYAVKTSVESMIELEEWKDKALRRQDRKNLLISYLLHDEDAPRPAVEALATNLGYTPNLVRAPLILVPCRGTEAPEALSAIKEVSLHGREDLSWAAPEGFVVVFKVLNLGEGGIIGSFESQITAYVAAARQCLGSSHGFAGCYVGAFQSDLGRYGTAYRQVLWLKERFAEAGDRLVFLHDHVVDYLSSRIPRSELVTALDGMASLVPPEAGKALGASMDALSDSALNGKEAAARLGVHRNTFTARMDRLARLMGRDPRHDARALELISLLARYLEYGGQGRGKQG
jgi:carbohydrate diacid regulator